MTTIDFTAVTTNAEVKQRARELAVSRAYRVYPENIGGTSVADLKGIARGPPGGDSSVYVLLKSDGSRGRLGEGFLPQRLRDHYGAAISRLAPRAPIRWSIPQEFVDFIVSNDFYLPYVVLAEGLAKADAFAGQQRIFDHFGIGSRSFLINPWRR